LELQQIVVETDGEPGRTRAVLELAGHHGLAHHRVFASPSTQERGLPNAIVLASRRELPS
jgi:hypothetical protein